MLMTKIEVEWTDGEVVIWGKEKQSKSMAGKITQWIQVPMKLARATGTGHEHTTGCVHSMGRVGVMNWDGVKSIVRGGGCIQIDGRLKSIPGGAVRLVGLVNFLAGTAGMES